MTNENIPHNEDERINRVNENLILISKKEGLTLGTDALLLASYIKSKKLSDAVELGAGTGIISLLLLAKDKVRHIEAIELQTEFASLCRRNADINGYGERLSVHCEDIRNVGSFLPCGTFPLVFSNPPYLKNKSGLHNNSKMMSVARRELNGTIGDFCAAAAKLLCTGGSFYCVYRPDRLAGLMFSLRLNRLEPKRLTFIHSHYGAPPSLLLMESRLDSGEELKITRPLFIYTDGVSRAYTEDMKSIYEGRPELE